MKYEIINPSDKCYITSNNELVARFCCLLLGNGHYVLRDENNNDIGNMYLFGATKETLDEEYDGDFEAFAKTHWKDIVTCFKSFEYEGERTSANNIGARAEENAKIFEQHYGGVDE